jgi:hypothetical protein
MYGLPERLRHDSKLRRIYAHPLGLFPRPLAMAAPRVALAALVPDDHAAVQLTAQRLMDGRRTPRMRPAALGSRRDYAFSVEHLDHAVAAITGSRHLENASDDRGFTFVDPPRPFPHVVVRVQDRSRHTAALHASRGGVLNRSQGSRMRLRELFARREQVDQNRLVRH